MYIFATMVWNAWLRDVKQDFLILILWFKKRKTLVIGYDKVSGESIL